MVKYSQEALDRTFAALADRTRRALLARLARGERSVTELAEPLAISLPGVMKHLAVLESAGLLRRAKSGRTVLCRLEAAPMKNAAEWISAYSEFWRAQLDALARHVEKPRTEEDRPWVEPQHAPSHRSPSRASSRHRRRRSSVRGSSRRR